MDEVERDGLFLKQLSENPSNNTSSGLLDAIDAPKLVDTVDISGQMEQLPQSSEPLETERARKDGKCNMRKSLAWDTAFFTSAGFLEPDELSSMIKVADKGAKHFLPGIEEDIHRSIDSISTLESESLTLESLEADLFEDIRASIQKSNKASNTTSSSKAATALKKEDLASNNMVKSKIASKKQTVGMQGPGKLIRQSSSHSQATQPLARHGGLTPSLPKPPKVIVRPNPILSAPLKRASLGANKVKLENDKAKGSSGEVDPVSTVSGLGGRSRTLPKPSPSSKFSSLSSSATTKKLPVRGSSVNSANGVSPVKSNRRIESKTVNPTSSSSILKKPSKVPVKEKEQAYLMSSKLSSNASPASSIISEWSSESSSSVSVNQMSNTSRVSIDTSSTCRSLDSDAPPALDYHNQSSDQTPTNENKANQRPSESLKKASVQSGALSRPATVKPTGLRMPSPKMGFFDGVKPVDRTPTGSMQYFSGIPAGSKTGARTSNPNGGSSKAKNTKLQPARTVTTTGNMKLDSKKPASPGPSPKPSNASPRVSNVSSGAKKFLSTSRVQNKTHGESCLKFEVGYEGPDGASAVPDTGLDAEMTRSLGELKGEINLDKQDYTNLKDITTVPIEGDTYASRSHCNVEKVKLSEEVGEDVSFSLQQLKNNMQALYKSDKENTQFQDQADGLSTHVGAVDSRQEVQKGLVGKCISQIDSSHPDSEFSCSKEFIGPDGPDQKGGSPRNLSGPTLISLSPVKSDITVSTRTPFAVKNSLNEDLSARLSFGIVENAQTKDS